MTNAVESLGRIRAQGLALLAAAFLAGGAAGLAGSQLWMSRRPPRPFVPAPRPDGLPPAFDRVDLTPDQRARIATILERARPRTDSLMRELVPRLRALTDSTWRDIRAVLTPEQLERIDRESPRFGPPIGMPGGGLGLPRMRRGGPGMPRGGPPP